MIITDGAKAYIEEVMKEHGVSTLRFHLKEQDVVDQAGECH